MESIEAKAMAWQVRISTDKARQVLRLIRGKKASEALTILKFTPNKGARYIEKTLKSALANAETILAWTWTSWWSSARQRTRGHI